MSALICCAELHRPSIVSRGLVAVAAVIVFVVATFFSLIQTPLNPCDNDHSEISIRGDWKERLVITKPISPGTVTLGFCSPDSGQKLGTH